MGSYRLISADNHVYEPQKLWQERVPASWKDRAPKIVSYEDSDYWFWNGDKRQPAFGGIQTGVRFEEGGQDKLQFKGREHQLRPGGWDPTAHVKDMEIDGVDVSILYPTVGLVLFTDPDNKWLSVMMLAYNDWLAEFCKPFPNVLKGVGMINLHNVDEGIEELERCANIGLVGGMISVYPPEDRPYGWSEEYEPFWAAAQDLEMPLSLHVGTQRPGPGLQPKTSRNPAFTANIAHWVRMSLGNMIYSGVFERFPKLQVGSIENEIAWVPHFLDRMDYYYTEKPKEFTKHRYGEDALPSDYFHRNVFVGFQEDSIGIRLRDITGVDNIQWGSDYPHLEGTWPKSREILDKILADCTEEEKARISGGNAARVYKFSFN